MKNKLIAALFGMSLLVGSASAQIVVRIGPPPPPRHEFVPVAPGPGYVWVPGHYLMPPRRHAHWVPGHWVEHRGGWYWNEGHWR